MNAFFYLQRDTRPPRQRTKPARHAASKPRRLPGLITSAALLLLAAGLAVLTVS